MIRLEYSFSQPPHNNPAEALNAPIVHVTIYLLVNAIATLTSDIFDFISA